MTSMHSITLAAHVSPGSMKALLGPDLDHVAEDQIGPHFARCEQAGICPWAAAREQIENCDDGCGPTWGCRWQASAGHPRHGREQDEAGA